MRIRLRRPLLLALLLTLPVHGEPARPSGRADLAARLAQSLAATAAPGAGTVTTVPTFCEMCFWRCGGIAYLRDGKLWKFEGNPKDPQSNGRLCPRGTGAVGAHYDPDRLRQPLIERFYAARSTMADKARILCGKPPVSIMRALSALAGQSAPLSERHRP